MKKNDRAPHRNATVLVVDDNAINLSTHFDFLHYEGFGVLVAQSGESAFDILNEKLPDIILLDVIMPGMDGFEVCRRLKTQERTRHIPVIFITALSDVEHKVEGFQVGAVDFITKPFHQKEVVARVDTHLQLCSLQQQLQKHIYCLEQEIQRGQRLETSLREREQQFQDIAENVREVFFVVTSDLKRFAYVNSTYETILGQSRQEIYKNPRAWFKQLHPDDRKRVFVSIKRLLYELEEFSEEFRVLHYGGTRWVWTRAFPVFDENGTLSRFVGVAEDITHRKQFEEELRQSDESRDGREMYELSEAAPVLERLAILLSESDMDAVKCFEELAFYSNAAGLGHELQGLDQALAAYDFEQGGILLTALLRKFQRFL